MRLGILICAVAIAWSGCGGDGGESRRPPEDVRLEISAPLDSAVVDGRTVDVRGRVSPASADVRVLGQTARVSGGVFTATVALAQGANVIDVAATAQGRSAAMTALRVTRDERVAVPALEGVALDDLEATLARSGLRVETEHGGGFFDEFLGGDPAVCEQDPAPGTKVERGTTVRVVVARSC